MRFLPVTPRALLVELADLDRTLALFDALAADPVDGIEDIVPAARTLMVRTAPGVAADHRIAAAVAARARRHSVMERAAAATPVEIPMTYDGADLAAVARHMGLSVAEVIAAHQAALWTVAFCGFAPGFAYMTCDDPRFDLPRRASPRTRIPAGAVALAARFCGVYPRDTPGGWQLIGTTRLRMWDLARSPPALLRPGVSARFVAGTARIHPGAAASAPTSVPAGLAILATAFPILFQDDGRPGQTGQGVSASGALDRGALHRANRAVGNPAGAAALEITLGPVRLRADRPVTLALTGAADRAVVVATGRPVPVTPGAAFAMDAGDELLIHPPRRGMRSYLALRGGYAVAPVLGSAATDTLAGIGPKPLGTGDVLAPADRPALAVAPPEPQPPLPRPGELIELPVTLGPRTDWFAPDIVARFLAQEWRVTPQSSRVGIRLEGDAPINRTGTAELPSEATEAGAVQIPHSGQPLLFLADHPLTGGYPVIATLLPEGLDRAGQCPPGARIRFTAARPFTPIEAEYANHDPVHQR
ncbi:urea amidolyase family protein [Sphingomonas flavalba]|uniref:5-oxoprolinase subunit B/C family protein n=1 Tax=Sphingomonas flavalba TaxID=2559804 RepID=UPI00109E1CB5|nr:urea amidolyase family protein [Sphingomonas flavalba]